MKQLHLEKKDLVKLGFKLKACEGKVFDDNQVHYVLETINGYFYYNPKETVYVWYHRTVLDKISNDVLLDIKSKTALFMLLEIFRIN